MFLKKKIIFFIFRYKLRRLALNNILQANKIGDFHIINLSGPYLSWFGLILYKINLFKNFKFISCDGWPFLNNTNNSINIWFGGTILKIPNKFKHFQNNYVTASNIFTKTKKIIQFYPMRILKTYENLERKIIIAVTVPEIKEEISLKIWKKKKFIILKNLPLLDNLLFWQFDELRNLDIRKKHSIYVQIKSLMRLELIKIIKNHFGNKCILIGDGLKKLYPDSLNSNFKKDFLKKYYNGNICLDFLAKDGQELLYPRSIEILESGGIIFQIKTTKSKQLYEKYENKITFTNEIEMVKKLENLLNHENILEINKFFKQKFDSEEYNIEFINKFFN